MKLFVGPLPGTASTQDVRNFIQSGISHKGWFGLFKRASGNFGCTMMEVPDSSRNGSIYFAIVQIPSPSLAQQAIANLNGASINGRAVRVRKFVERNPANDRRLLILLNYTPSQRKGERRGQAVRRIFRTEEAFAFRPVEGFSRVYDE
jgi:RNA recognition motif-containing protein